VIVDSANFAAGMKRTMTARAIFHVITFPLEAYAGTPANSALPTVYSQTEGRGHRMSGIKSYPAQQRASRLGLTQSCPPPSSI